MADTDRRAPVQGFSQGIPWSVHARAWDAYNAKYLTGQSAERIAERGGFSTGELDVFAPGWREEASEIARLKAEIARLTDHGFDLDRIVADVMSPKLGSNGFIIAPPELVQFLGHQWIVMGFDMTPDIARGDSLKLRFQLRRIKDKENTDVPK